MKKLSAKMLHPQVLSEKLKNISDELLEERNRIELLVNAFKDFKEIINQIDEYKQKYELLFLEDEDIFSEECEKTRQAEQTDSCEIQEGCQPIGDKSYEEAKKSEPNGLATIKHRAKKVRIKLSEEPKKVEQTELNIVLDKASTIRDKYLHKSQKTEQAKEDFAKHAHQALSAKAYVEHKKAQKSQLDIAQRQSQTISDKPYEEPKEAQQTDSSRQDNAQTNSNKFRAAKKLLEKYSNL